MRVAKSLVDCKAVQEKEGGLKRKRCAEDKSATAEALKAEVDQVSV